MWKVQIHSLAKFHPSGLMQNLRLDASEGEAGVAHPNAKVFDEFPEGSRVTVAPNLGLAVSPETLKSDMTMNHANELHNDVGGSGRVCMIQL